ncbi:MAG: cell envelope-related function transcriptional attenuator common domain protein [Oscillospiraceae bacterium]|jgi:LCP family protein required for cell wall assembly|nr:cell envelope-related function transcriptional attenuator common domain protein [Oscillospiraceae bacterium]
MNTNKEKTSKMVFVLTFVVSALIFIGLVGASLLWGGTVQNLAKLSSSAVSSQNNYKPVKEDELVVLVIGCEQRNLPARAFVLLKIDPAQRKISVCSIPKEVETTVNTRTDTLAGFYDYGSSLMAVEAVQNAFNIYINKYVRIDNATFSAMIDIMGGIDYDVPYDITPDEDNQTTKVFKGRQLIDGKRLYSILSVNNNRDDLLSHIHLQTNVIAQTIDQKITKSTVNVLDKVYSGTINLVDTNITSYDFTSRKEALLYICDLGSEKANPVLINGEYKQNAFYVDDKSLEQIVKEFGTNS